ncbi:helix-turn-helix domain-containing protein [Herbiconiux sp. P15]|uniref:helix-turn-helix domain-containing protein n=1 Tax=Herbiconiux liukaitaii TaxID=3342799 RepID=UPI0035B7FF9E
MVTVCLDRCRLDHRRSAPRCARPARKGRTIPSGSLALDEQTERLGARIRSFRQARGLTLVELARLAGLSHPFLSQLERGQARPSMVSLERIARALGSSQIELIAAATDDLVPPSGTGRVSMVRRLEGPQGPFGGGEARILVHGDVGFVPMEFRGSNREPGEFYTHEEDEFLHVVSGSVLVDLADEGEFELERGDSIHYAGGTLHRWWSLDAEEYHLLIVKERRAGS